MLSGYQLGMPIVWRRSIRRKGSSSTPAAAAAGAVHGAVKVTLRAAWDFLTLPIKVVGKARGLGFRGVAAVALLVVTMAVAGVLTSSSGEAVPALLDFDSCSDLCGIYFFWQYIFKASFTEKLKFGWKIVVCHELCNASVSTLPGYSFPSSVFTRCEGSRFSIQKLLRCLHACCRCLMSVSLFITCQQNIWRGLAPQWPYCSLVSSEVVRANMVQPIQRFSL